MSPAQAASAPLDLSEFSRSADGYLVDPSGAPDVALTLGQQAMQSTIVPRIYERLWRPVLFGVMAGGRLDRIDPRTVAASLDLDPAACVLDVACGPGNTTRPIADSLGESGRVIGFDASPAMLRQAVSDTSDSRIDYVLGDAASLPFADDTFDAVTCLAALYLMDEPYKVIAELVRVLRPGGAVALMASCRRGPDAVQPLLTLNTKVSGIKMFDSEELRDRLVLLGLTDVRREVHGMFQLVTATLPGGSNG